MSDLAVELLPADAEERAAERWRALEAALTDPPLLRGWDWTGAWLRAYGDVVPHRFAFAERDGTTVAAALVTASRATSRADLGLRLLHLGTAGEPAGEGVFAERNGVLAAPGELAAFARALLAALEGERGWDELRLDGFQAGDADAFAAASPRVELAREASPCTDLAAIRAAGGDVVAALAKGPRSRIRRSLRAMGELSGEWAASVDEALAVFDELVDLHQARWRAAGEPGAFASPRVVGFHRDLIAALQPSGRVALYRLREAGTTLACIYGTVDRGRLLFYQSGFADSGDGKRKPGLVAHATFMQACLERGLGAYDFLAGEARYKRELATGEDELVWGRLSRRGPRSLASAALRRIGGRPRPVTPFEL